MHVIVPFASGMSEASRHVLHDLELPQLAAIVATFEADARDDADPHTYSPPHERAIAASRHWRGEDGTWPFAAECAMRDGVDAGGLAWGLLTPCHWLLGRDHVVMTDPASLDLDEAASRALFAAARPLFEDDGFTAEWGAPTRWYVARDDLDGFPTASLDRVIGRDVEAWIGHDDAAREVARRVVRRLQSEVQILWHTHDVNDAREADGLASINSFWLSGCGRAQAGSAADALRPDVDDRLRTPALAADWVAYADAWRALDDGPLRALAQRAAEADSDGAASITLCGERAWQRLSSRRLSAWQRWRRRASASAAHALLVGL